MIVDPLLLLADVFEKTRNEYIISFELDRSHYLSTSGYGWDVMIKFTSVDLNLTSDVKKYQFIESMEERYFNVL